MAATGPDPDNSRTSMVSVRLSREEAEELRAEAARSGKTLSQFVRDVALQRSRQASDAVDLRLYPVSTTTIAGGLAIEARDGQLVPKTTQPYVSAAMPC
jgi:hypothetical protein